MGTIIITVRCIDYESNILFFAIINYIKNFSVLIFSPRHIVVTLRTVKEITFLRE